MSSTKANFYCPNGGEWYVCLDAEISFIGCCTINPCPLNSSCPLESLQPATFNTDLYGSFNDANCFNGLFYTCADTSPPFFGCCNVNPCISGCPTTNYTPAYWNATEWSPISLLPYLGIASKARPGAPYIANTPNFMHVAPAWNYQSSMRLSSGATAGIIISSMVALLILSISTTVVRFKRYSKQRLKLPLQNQF
jgi:hypothetical protein